jgi:hypothetical protein
MRTDCPRDSRIHDDQAERLTCTVMDCRCAECRRALAEAETMDWVGE